MLQVAVRQVGRGVVQRGSSSSNLIVQQTRQRSIRSISARCTDSILSTCCRKALHTNAAAIPVSLSLQTPVILSSRDMSTTSTSTKLSSVKVLISVTVSDGIYDEDEDDDDR